ncbi:MAG: hypothetical protein WAM97_22045 [Acidimicrobiales bacterium]
MSISATIAYMARPEPAIGDILFSETEIRNRLAEPAAEIDTDYAGRDLVLLGVRIRRRLRHGLRPALPQPPVHRHIEVLNE